MMIDNGDGTRMMGPLDVVLILQHTETGRYHVCLLEEAPPPGPLPYTFEMENVRLRSKMTHTEGTSTLVAAAAKLAELRTRLVVLDANVVDDCAYPWDGGAFVLVLPNWCKAKGGQLRDSLRQTPVTHPAPPDRSGDAIVTE